MYQSPVAAMAELVANAWDADAEHVSVVLPGSLGQVAEIVIADDGIGMTFEECQGRYLNVGWCRRGDNADEYSVEKHRPILGRKGIGKFAGFGIATVVKIETVSKQTGEKTVFQLDISQLRSKEYVSTEDAEIPVLEYLEPDQVRKSQHGTKIILKQLKLAKRPSVEQYRKSMARRFLLHQGQSQFKLSVIRYRQHHPDGEIVEAYWLTNLSSRRTSRRCLYAMAKSRWQIENQGFNDAKNRYGLGQIRHHHKRSLLLVWLLICLSLTLERLYRLRYLHRGGHPVRTAIDLLRLLQLGLSVSVVTDSS
jgi:hypothetical protein